MTLLAVNNISKAYRSYSSEWKRFAHWFGAALTPSQEQYVLKNLNFKIEAGEAVGIVGRNGAGKSTLLKIITGTLAPTTGNVVINGRIAAILELGMGFNPDLTGRQNVYYAAGLMGFTVPQIDSAIDEIEEFAEVGEYFDASVRTYSSGMQMRVAFAVATAYRPEILIVDEALSVGDTYFQHKSFNRIREFQKEGTSLLIVSHDRNAIQALCTRAILLDRGVVMKDGEPEAVMDFYNAMLADSQNQLVEQRSRGDGKTETKSGTGEVTVSSITLLDGLNNPVEIVDVGERVHLHVEVVAHAAVERLVFGYGIKDRLGQVMYGTNTDLKRQPLVNVKAGDRFVFDIAFPVNLGPGSYSVQTALTSSDTHLVNNYEWRDLALVFNVTNINKPYFAGCSWIDPEISVEQL